MNLRWPNDGSPEINCDINQNIIEFDLFSNKIFTVINKDIGRSIPSLVVARTATRVWCLCMPIALLRQKILQRLEPKQSQTRVI